MSDYSFSYTSDKSSKIIISRNNVFVTFKPFIESFSFSKNLNFIEVTSMDNFSVLNKGQKERKYNVSFNVPANDYTEAINNHKKFQKLMRMCMPDSDRKSFILIKFANLIHRESPNFFSASDGQNEAKYKDFLKKGLACKISSLEYSPDMDLGFFDDQGLFFAKNYKISLDLDVDVNSFPTKKLYTAAQIKDKSIKKVNIGKLFGYDVKYK